MHRLYKYILALFIVPASAVAELPVIDPSMLAETVKNGASLSNLLAQAENMSYKLAEMERAMTGKTAVASKVLGKVRGVRNKAYSMRSSIPHIPELEGSVFRNGRIFFESKDKIFDVLNSNIYKTSPNDPYGRHNYPLREQYQQQSYITAMAESEDVLSSAEQDVDTLQTLANKAASAADMNAKLAVLNEMQLTELAFLQDIKTLLANLVRANAVAEATGVHVPITNTSSNISRNTEAPTSVVPIKKYKGITCTVIGRKRGLC